MLALLWGGCITEVCELESSQVEVDVTFTGFSLSEAVTLEIDSTVIGPPVTEDWPNYYSRRVGYLQFPEAARDGSEKFIFDPGAYVRGLQGTEELFTFIVVMRVWGDGGLLLAEGRFSMIDSETSGCFLARSMTVSGQATCSDKEEGDPCVGSAGAPRVCMDVGGSLGCESSTCGDGFVDRQRGELCDPTMTGSVECDENCLPRPVEVTLHEGGPLWHQVADAGGEVPPPRAHAAAVRMLDAGTPLILMFGGVIADANGDPTYLNDTWIFDGVGWQPDAQAAPPPPRRHHAMAWDETNNVVVMFGGDYDDGDFGNGQELRSDTWIYTPGVGWAESSATIPAGLIERHSAGMAYDPGGPNVVLFGGRAAGSTLALSDTWVYDHQVPSWTELAGAGGDERYDHTITYFPQVGSLVALGGQSGSLGGSQLWTDALAFQAGSWVVLADTAHPTGRTSHQTAYLPDAGLLVMFGGWDRTQDDDSYGVRLRDTWECAWSNSSLDCVERSTADAPTGRQGHVMAELGGKVYAFGGVTGTDDVYLNDTWVFETPGPEKSSFVLTAGLKNVTGDETTVQGYHDVSVPDEERDTLPQEYAGSLLLADLDGDGLDELAISLPGGHCTENENEVCGKVIVKDHQLFDQSIGELRNDFATFVGRDSGPGGSWLGSSMASADINGDGARDLVVGAPMGISGTGSLYIAFGGDEHAFPIAPLDSYTIQVGRIEDGSRYLAFNGSGDANSNQPHHLGYQVAVADFDGDGFADVVASAPTELANAVDRSAVYVLAGPGTNWPTGAQPASVVDYASLVVTTATPGMQLGISLAAEDLDGDGFADLIIGSATTDPPTTGPQFGAVAVLFGGEGFFDRVDKFVNVEDLAAPEGALVAAQNDTGPISGIGGTVAAADLDGDGAADLAATLGRPSRDALTPHQVALIPGTAFEAYRWTGQLSALTARITILHGPPGSGFGAHLLVGHANGDRTPDLLIGAPYEPGPSVEGALSRDEVGAVYVLLGSRLAEYWDRAADLYIEDLLTWDVSGDGGPIPIPLLIVHGNQAHGFFGTASAVGGHIAQQDPIDPHAYTLVYQPGWYDGQDPLKVDRGRVWTLYLPHLLPCGSEPYCPLP